MNRLARTFPGSSNDLASISSLADFSVPLTRAVIGDGLPGEGRGSGPYFTTPSRGLLAVAASFFGIRPAS